MRIDDSVSPRTFNVTSGGIYYVTRTPRSDGRYELRVVDPLTSRRRVLSAIDVSPVEALAVSPDRSTILYNRTKNPQSDLMLIENFR